MNAYYSRRSAEALRRIVAHLSPLGGRAFIYGSSARAFQVGHDIDLLFVYAEEHHERIYREVAVVQEACPLPLHPTVVTPLAFATNPRIRELSQLGRMLW
jgi:hypothetical protein